MKQTGKTKAIQIRVTEEQLSRLKAAAEAKGLPLGPWLRSMGLREAVALLDAGKAAA